MSKKRWVPEKGPVRTWRIGQIVQGVVLGVMLIFAGIGWVAHYGNVTAFKYQGF